MVTTYRLRDSQVVLLAGCSGGVEEDQVWEIGVEGEQPAPILHCEAEKADTRLWLHVLRSPGACELKFSHDTDVHHIGLPLIANQSLSVYVIL